MISMTRMEFCKFCRDYRRDVLHKSQKAIAEEIGVTQQAVSKFENGERFWGMVLLYYLDILGIADFKWRE